MSAWSNTDSYTSKPRIPKMRLEHGVVKLSANAFSGPGTTINFAPNATLNIANGWTANVGNTFGTVGFNQLGPIVTNKTPNSVTLSQTIQSSMNAGTIITFSKPITFHGNTLAGSYNANTVLVTTTRRKNASKNVANATAHIGWNHVRYGTGGRSGRVQVETLVVIATPKATDANSGGVSFTGT